MKPDESVAELKVFVEAAGASLTNLSPELGFALMLSFYERVPAAGCSGPSADMLLFEWGTYDWGEGESFELSLSRQFIEQDGDGEDAISQLRLVFKYKPVPDLAALGEGDRWCESPDQAQDFGQHLRASAAYQRLAGQDSPTVGLTHTYV
jgi:hypothetical protein